MSEAALGEARKHFSKWQQSLVAKNSKADREVFEQPQQELRSAIAGGIEVLAVYLRRQLSIEGVDLEAPPFPRVALTADEFREPPRELENELAGAWEGYIQPAQASQPLYWLLSHITWLEQGRFGVDDLASALTASPTSLDDQTRTFLRRSSGLPHIRGNISVFSDCPLARAWWRCRVVSAVADDSGGAINREDAHRVLHDHRPVWETLVMLSLRRITVINQLRARAALVTALAECDKPDPATVQRMALALARQGLARSLEHAPWSELHQVAARAARQR